MKKFGKFLLTTVLVLALAMSMSACSKSSSDSGPVASSTTTTQAAASTSTAMNAMTTVSQSMGAGMSLGLSSVPAGYTAPRFAKRYGNGNVGSIDPTLKMMVDSMTKYTQLPMLQKAVKKAAMFKAARAHDVPMSSVPCDGGGSFTIKGTTNSGESSITADIYTYDIVFSGCTDTSDPNNVTELSGTLSTDVNSSLSTTAYSKSINANLTTKTYDSGSTLRSQVVLIGTFSDSDQITTGSTGANGSYVTTYPRIGTTPEKVFTFAFTNISGSWTSTHNITDGSDSDVNTTGGSFSVSTASGGTENFKFNLGLNLADKWQYMTDTVSTEKNWINGSVSLGWVPDLSASGCVPGSIAIATTDADPLTYNSSSGYDCPASGTVTVNGATVAFGSSSGTASDIIVSVSGSSQTYASCAAFEAAGGACSYQ